MYIFVSNKPCRCQTLTTWRDDAFGEYIPQPVEELTVIFIKTSILQSYILEMK